MKIVLFMTILTQKKIIKKAEKNPEEYKVEKPSHKGITCDGCGISPIVGCRYK